jgi:hypothetical protein
MVDQQVDTGMSNVWWVMGESCVIADAFTTLILPC